MLIGIVVLTFFLSSIVLGQSVEFEMECHILKTLELLETRLQEQQILLQQENIQREKENVHQNASILDLLARLDQQDALLEEQNATLKNLEIRLQEQQTILQQEKAHSENQEVNHNVTFVEMQTRLEQLQANIRELEEHITPSNKSTDDKSIGFTVQNPANAEKASVIRFTTIYTNVGGGYNTSTGEYYCSVAGLYYFSLHLINYGWSTVDKVLCSVYRNDDAIAFTATNAATTADGGFYGTSTSVVVHLSSGDIVYPGACTDASTMFDKTSFSGFLIRAD